MSREAPTYAEFIATFPAFAAIDEPVINFQLGLFSKLLSVGSWDMFFSDGVGLISAHNMAMANLISSNPLGAFQGAAGPVSSVSAAGVSTSFSAPDMIAGSKSDSWYSKTVYGQQYLMLRDMVMGLGVMAS